MDSIVACAVLPDAAWHILEWLAFHRMIGVDRFVLYDQGGAGETAERIANSRFARQATVISFPREAERAAVYADFVARHAAGFAWAVMLEMDEFLHPLTDESLHPLLPRYEGFSGVRVRRLAFLVSGIHRPGQLVITSHVHRAADASSLNSAGVALLRVADIRGMASGQAAFVMAGEMCDGGGHHVTLEQMPAGSDDVLVVNRYRRATEQGETAVDRRILRFAPRLRALLHDGVPAAPPVRGQPPAPVPVAVPQRQRVVAPLLGIGVITYNRCPVLAETLDLVQRHTRHPRTVVAVADDGSTDGTLAMLRERRTLTVTGRNMSIAWNKNRALFLLAELVRCDIVILLEDDSYPERDDWEAEWILAAQRWGHATATPSWLRQEHAVSGSGTVDDPIESEWISAQCAVFSREALLYAGYFDTRFRGYGHEHVEHTCRLLRMGYGPASGQAGKFKSIWGGVGVRPLPSTFEAKEQLAEPNRELATTLLGDTSYRAPWQSEDEARQFRAEMRQAWPQAVP